MRRIVFSCLYAEIVEWAPKTVRQSSDAEEFWKTMGESGQRPEDLMLSSSRRTCVLERSDISLIRCPGTRGPSGGGVGEVEDRVMMGGGVDGFMGGEEGLLRGLLVDAREESGEDESMGAFVTAETVGEEVLVL